MRLQNANGDKFKGRIIAVDMSMAQGKYKVHKQKEAEEDDEDGQNS